jgi:hypothetical protein
VRRSMQDTTHGHEYSRSSGGSCLTDAGSCSCGFDHKAGETSSSDMPTVAGSRRRKRFFDYNGDIAKVVAQSVCCVALCSQLFGSPVGALGRQKSPQQQHQLLHHRQHLLLVHSGCAAAATAHCRAPGALSPAVLLLRCLLLLLLLLWRCWLC